MPFDGTTDQRTVHTIKIIDLMLEILGPNGERWLQGGFHDVDGNHCILGALRYVRRRLGTSAEEDDATHCIQQAIRVGGKSDRLSKWCDIQWFNDDSHREFQEIRAALHAARELAHDSRRMAACSPSHARAPPRLRHGAGC